MRLALGALVSILILSHAPPLLAQQTPTTTPVVRGPGRDRLTISASFGNAVVINGSVETDIAGLWVRWSRALRKPFLGGQPAYGFEFSPILTIRQRPRAYGFGGHFIYEQRYRPDRALRPVLRLGAGMIYTNHRVPVNEQRYNFSLFASAGIEVDTAPRTALSLEYRLHHVSNADTGIRNPGINANTFLIDLTRRF